MPGIGILGDDFIHTVDLFDWFRQIGIFRIGADIGDLFTTGSFQFQNRVNAVRKLAEAFSVDNYIIIVSATDCLCKVLRSDKFITFI